MQALPSIAFGGFSGSAKGVTARQVAGRTILSVKSWPTGQTTNAQVARRTSMSKISKSWKLLSNVDGVGKGETGAFCHAAETGGKLLEGTEGGE